MSDQTITRKQFTQATVSANNPDLQKILKDNYNEDFDTNGDGKLDASDFGVSKDGTISKEGMKQLFAYADSFDDDGKDWRIKNQGVAGEIYAATRQENASPNRKISDTYRSSAADKPLTAEQKQLAQTAFHRIKSKIPTSQHKEIEQKFEQLAQKGHLDWLKQTKLPQETQTLALYQQLIFPNASASINQIAKDPLFLQFPNTQQNMLLHLAAKYPSKELEQAESTSAKTPKPSLAYNLLHSETFRELAGENKSQAVLGAALQNPKFAKHLESLQQTPDKLAAELRSRSTIHNVDVAGISPKQQEQIKAVFSAHPQIAEQMAKLPEAEKENALKKMASDIQIFQQNIGKTDQSSVIANAKELQNKPWLLSSLPAQEAHGLMTTLLANVGQMHAAQNPQAVEVKKALESVKESSPGIYKILFQSAYTQLTTNPLDWRSHLLDLTVGIITSNLPIGKLEPFVGAAASGILAKVQGKNNQESWQEVAISAISSAMSHAVGLHHANKSIAQLGQETAKKLGQGVAKRTGLLLNILKTVFMASYELYSNKKTQEAVQSALEQSKYASIMP